MEPSDHARSRNPIVEEIKASLTSMNEAERAEISAYIRELMITRGSENEDGDSDS